MAEFEPALKIVLRHEGGFVNDPTDPGGATNLGVTKKNWELWVGHVVDLSVIEQLTVADVTPLYKKWFWDKLNLDTQVDQRLAEGLFDFYVNVSPKTYASVVAAAIPLTQHTLFREKVRHYLDETAQRRKRMPHPDAEKFLYGWLTRAMEFI